MRWIHRDTEMQRFRDKYKYKDKYIEIQSDGDSEISTKIQRYRDGYIEIQSDRDSYISTVH